jgi:hypothetical protein
MSSESTYEEEVQHYAYTVLKIFPLFPTEIALFGLLIEPFLIETTISYTNILIWGCILLHYSD